MRDPTVKRFFFRYFGREPTLKTTLYLTYLTDSLNGVKFRDVTQNKIQTYNDKIYRYFILGTQDH